ncbi:MAG: D-2-hydroxyacid dehydrogenase [Gammaproteobacteria bacterium]|nr:D-2-hydroxyacid dehydrogenase [Gammaproteobacteria bacterium]
MVVRGATPERLQWLQEAAPGVQIVGANTAAQAVALAGTADAIMGFCSADLVAAAPRLRWIQASAAGVENCVSIPALRERGILLTNMQKIAGPVMAEHVVALTFAFARELPFYLREQGEGRWSDATSDSAGGAFRLQGRTMFIAGLGGIGMEVAQRAHALGMRVTATRASKQAAPPFVERVGTPEDLVPLIREADIVVNTLPLTASTRAMFDAGLFAAMKPGAYFINVGRGGTVVTDDLVQALRSGQLAGAGLDVTDPEPLPAGHALWKMPNVIITPHVAADTGGDVEDRWLLFRENLRRYTAGGKMLSVVDVARGY